MKKLIFSVMAIAALFVTSCVQDVANDAQVAVGGEATVRFSVESAQLGSRAYGVGAEATDLYYAVYNNGTLLDAISKMEEPVKLVNGTTQLNLKLATGLTYDFIFWAAAPAAWNNIYTIDWATQKMTIDPAKLVAQDENLDAFWKKVTITVTGNSTEGVELKRPFAQVNVAANQQDVEDAAKAGLEVAQTQVKILAFTELDLFTGEVAAEQELTYVYADQAVGELNGRDHLAMVYVLVNEYDTVPVTFNYTSTRGAECTLSVPMLPVQRNYKTNIVGNILTSSNDFEIEVNPDFETPDNEVEVVPANVSTAAELKAALEDEETNLIIFEEDINLNDLLASGIMSRAEAADPSIAVKAGKTLTINLNGKKLVATSAQTGKNYNMFDVNNGNLTVANGTIEYKHVGTDMGWNASTNLFNVTAGGVLTLDGVVAKNLGGSAMAFVAHLNNWGEVTLNVTNCELESTYIAVRAFNSGYDMNNITIKNSTLKGKFCYWVHNYKAAGDSAGTDATLNVDIYNGTNTFVCTGKAPVLYGFANPIYEAVVKNEADLAAALEANLQVAFDADVELANPVQIANGKNVTLKLNDNTLSAVDSASGSYGLITNKGNLTVVGPGKLALKATNNRGWNAYSSVISNTVGGNLVVDGGVVIEHLGGTDMAYGIDNLTNGKGTSAVVTVKNATVKSPYRAIRQFLNGVEATNEFYVEAGAVVEGANKSIWMQDPSAKANTGKLVVDEGAQLKGNVYLYVCEGSTEWPVEVSIASKALVDGSEVLTGNVPVQYEVVEENGFWVVNSWNIANTIEELYSYTKAGQDVMLGSDLTVAPSYTAPYGNKMILEHNGGILNGNNHLIRTTTGGDHYGIMTSGGTLKDLTIDAFRGVMIMYPSQDVVLENVKSYGDETCYALNTGEKGAADANVIANNCVFGGWTSLGDAVKSVTFNDCKFQQGTYYTNVYGRLVKPYINAVFNNCEFGNKYYIDLSALGANQTIVLKNCTVNGVKLTAENWTSLVAPEDTCGDGQISIELKNGTYMTAENVADYVVFE